MLKFKLAPRIETLSHRDWAASICKEECFVYAASEKHARWYASCAFGIATKKDGGPLRFCPWGQFELVECIALPDDETDATPIGMVRMAEGSNHPDFMAVGPNSGEIWRLHTL